MTETDNQTGSRKKLLVPVVALMICAVAFVGAAYAYTSSFNVTDNKITGETFVLEVNDGEGELLTEPISIKAIDFTTATVLGATNSVVVTANTLTANTYVGILEINDSDATNGAKTLAVTASATTVDGTIAASEVSGASGGPITYTVAVALYTDAECNTSYGGSVTFSGQVAQLYYKVTVTASGSLSFANADPLADVTLVKNQLANEKFTLAFEATAPTA